MSIDDVDKVTGEGEQKPEYFVAPETGEQEESKDNNEEKIRAIGNIDLRKMSDEKKREVSAKLEELGKEGYLQVNKELAMSLIPILAKQIGDKRYYSGSSELGSDSLRFMHLHDSFVPYEGESPAVYFEYDDNRGINSSPAVISLNLVRKDEVSGGGLTSESVSEAPRKRETFQLDTMYLKDSADQLDEKTLDKIALVSVESRRAYLLQVKDNIEKELESSITQ